MPTISSFKSIENNHDDIEVKIVWKSFLREHTMQIINFKKRKWSYEQNSSKNHLKMRKFVIFAKKKTESKYLKDQKYI